MSGKIIGFLREYVFIFSIIFTILGCIVLVIGLIGMWFKNILIDMLGISEETLDWSLYILIIGFIVFVIGVYYLYSFLTTRKFVVEELETNKRSEFLKKHVEVEQKVKHLPSKYKKMLTEKEEELQIK